MADGQTVPEREQFKTRLIALIKAMSNRNLSLTRACGHFQAFPADLARKVEDQSEEGRRWLDAFMEVSKTEKTTP